MAKRLRLFSHRVTSRTGQYHTSTKSYSRKLCLKTMLGMEPSISIIFIRCDGVTFERAVRSKQRRHHQRQVWHFYSYRVEKVEDVTLNIGELSALGIHQDVEENC